MFFVCCCITSLIDFASEAQKAEDQLAELDLETKSVDDVNQLIDFMTQSEASGLNEQLRELELLEAEKKSRASNSSQSGQRSGELGGKLSEFGAFVTSTLGSSESAAASSKTDSSDLLSFGEGQQHASNILHIRLCLCQILNGEYHEILRIFLILSLSKKKVVLAWGY